ncbi:MAG: hypothetical protein ACE5OW_03705, partial [Candidatus Bathyarchaeia archaeon]
EEVQEVEFEVAPEPTMDELIESIEGIVEGINEALDALTNRVEALEQAQRPTEEETLTGQQGEKPEAGEPKRDKERLAAHFGQEVAMKLLDLIGEEAYRLLPERGTKVEERRPQEELEKVQKTGEAIITGNVTPSGMISKIEIIKRLREAVYERVPHHWGYGPFEQNRKIKRLIRELESSGKWPGVAAMER